MIDESKPWISRMDDAEGRQRAIDVRSAISQCVDREAILDTILGGQGRVAYTQYIHPDTALYAKVDTNMLRPVAQPWIGGVPCR